SRPNAEVRWFKGRAIIRDSEKYEIRAEGCKRTLVVLQCSFDDEKKYTCDADDARTSAKLTVQARAIKFLKPLEQKIRVTEREEVVFEIELSHTDVEVIWYKNGAKMARTKNVELYTDGAVHKMVIHRANMEDYGVEVVAQAEEETSMTTLFIDGNIILIRIFVTEPPVKFPRTLSDKTCEEMDRVVLECEVSRANANVVWLKNNEAIEASDKYLVEVEGIIRRLILIDASIEDNAEWTCDGKDSKTVCNLIVKDGVKFTKPLSDVNVLEKDGAVLQCEISDPDVKVRWYKDGLPITNSDRVTIEANGKIHSVSLPWTLCSDTGSYQVVAEFAKSDAKLTVEAAPIMNMMQSDIVLVAGEKLRIRVPFTGSPLPNIEWTRDEKAIKDYIKTRWEKDEKLPLPGTAVIKNTDASSEVTITDCGRDDSGRYTIVSKNIGGTRTASCKVLVKDTPGAPLPLVVSNVTKRGAKLSWKTPCNDGGSKIQTYIVEKRRADGRGWVKLDSSVSATQFNVLDLLENFEYYFRVCAVNSIGQGVFAETTEPILARDPTSIPDPPAHLRVTGDITKSAVSLVWKVPDTDGGSKIKGYHVEMQEGDSEEWIKATKHDQRSCEFVVPDLPQGKKYNFRVIALNAAGQGEPGYIAEPVIIQEKQEMPEISLNKMIVRVGEPYRILVKISGKPAPTVTWEQDGKLVQTDSRFQIKTTPTTSALEVHKGERKDSGLYKVTVQNDGGQRDGNIILAVVNKPTPPRDLDVKEVTHEHVLLTWEAPEDDGGSELLNYVIEKRDISRMMWTTVNSTSLKTEFRISKLSEGSEYVFRVMAENNQGCSNPAETQGVVVKDRYRVPDAPDALTIKEVHKDSVSLSWNKPYDGGKAIFNYVVEKREIKSERWWTNFKTVPKTLCTVADLKEGVLYKLRVRAVNEAGESRPDHTVPVAPRQKLSSPSVEIDVKTLEGLTVRAGSTLRIPATIHGIPVPTAQWSTADGNVVVTDDRITCDTDSNSSLLTIRSAIRSDTQEYSLTAKNEAGTKSAAVHVTVLDRPGMPIGPMSIEMTPEYAIISWMPPKDDGGSQITNYVVEKKDTSKQTWVVTASVTACAYPVPRLLEGNEYIFRVKAENKMGLGPAIESSPVVAKSPYDKPGAPSAPEITKIGNGTATIAWKAPDKDGGRDISGYFVEKREKKGVRWSPCNTKSIMDRRLNVLGLSIGYDYQFRVAAENEMGVGEPSEPSKMAIAAPSITLDASCRELLVVRAGQDIVIEATIVGKPKPTAMWTRGEDQIKSTSDGSVTAETLLNQSRVIIRSCKRSDAGNYVLTLENTSGKTSATAKVRVLDVPGMPEGPAKFSNVLSDRLKLIWNRPLEDGGAAITNYVIERRETSRPTWAMVSGSAQGTELAVQKLIQNHEYEFRISAENKYGIGQSLVTEPIIVKNPFSVPSAAEPPSVSNAKKEGMTVSWKSPSEDGGKPISGYYLEKRETKAVQWVKVNRRPVSDRSIKVTGLIEGAEYEFRVAAENVAGIGEFSLPSQPATADDPKYPPAPPAFPKVLDTTRSTGTPAKLKIPVQGAPKPEIKWTKDDENLKEDTRVSVEVTAISTVVVFKEIRKEDAGKYIVAATNVVGKKTATIKFVVVGKPGVPYGPCQISDLTAEHATLTWNAPKDNGAPKFDGGHRIAGYDVERLNLPGKNWIRCNVGNISATNFEVTNLTPGSRYDFRIRAKNTAGSVSEPSETTGPNVCKEEYDAPGTPGKPEVTKATKTTMTVTWERPESDGGNEIIGYHLERHHKKDTWVKCPVPVRYMLTEYTVGDLVENREYRLRVAAVNKAGVGEFVMVSGKVVAKDVLLAPDMEIDAKIFMVVRAGDTAKFTIRVYGKPSPAVRWCRDGRDIEVSPRVKFDHSTTHTTLIIEDTTKNDSGEYELVVKNAVGTKTATLRVVVMEKPAPPTGPMEIKDVSAESITVAWGQPEEDGGTPVTHYTLEKLDCNIGWTEVSGFVVRTSQKITRLTTGQEYIFRVRAANKFGLSEPLDSAPVMARHPFNKPGTPSAPQVVSVTNDSVVITWQEPTNDGGSAILGYHIERKDRNSIMWTKANSYIVRDSTFKCGNLSQGLSYEFRVTAENLAGFGKPSDSTGSVTARDEVEPASVDVDAQYRDVVCVKAGEAFTLKTYVSGKPVPTISWEKDGNEFESGPRVSILTTETTSNVTVKDAHRADSGTYTIKVHNLAGDRSIGINVRVLDTPGMCELVTVSGITAEKCNLAWQSPTLNGGAKVTGYSIEKRETSRLAWTVVVHGTEFNQHKVTGLINGNEYVFRVRAENKFGLGEPVETNPVVAKNPFVVADAPGVPEVSNIMKNSCTVMWTRPESDGGAEITGYIVERREKNSARWHRVNRRLVSDLRLRVTDLREGSEQEFRIYAENRAGVGQASESSGFVTMTDPLYVPEAPGIPRVTDSTKSSLVEGKAGTTVQASILIKGKPAPTTQWKRDGAELKMTSRVNYDTVEGNAILTIKDADLKDAGNYQLVLENSIGSKTIPVSVRVLDKPGPPKGPVEFSGVTADSLVLSWSAPEADGGAAINNYIVDMRETSGDATEWRMISGSTARNSLKVTRLRPGMEYAFRIRAENRFGIGHGLESPSIKAQFPFKTPGSPSAPTVVATTRETMTIKWEVPMNDGGSKILGYHVEKKDRNSILWIKCSKTLVSGTDYKITNLQESLEYEFRVYAENAAGFGKTSKSSDSAIARDAVDPPHMDARFAELVTVRAGRTIKIEAGIRGKPTPIITWKKDEQEFKLSGRISVKNTDVSTCLEITDADRDDTAAYSLAVQNFAGSRSLSIQVKVLDKPGRPTGPITISGTTAEKCTISWRAPERDGGAPIINYVVEKRETSHLAWVLVNPSVEGTTCKISKLLADNEYIFRVRAENKYGVGDALESVEIIAKNPFTTPSAPQSLEVTSVNNNSVTLAWGRPKHDGGSEIAGYAVEKKIRSGLRWIRANKKTILDMRYKVQDLSENQEYEFRVFAKNDKGLSDPATLNQVITVKDIVEAPEIHLRDLPVGGIHKKAGSNINISIPISGKPKPEVVWKKNGEVIKQTTRVCTVSSAIQTSICIKSCKLEDTGNYEIAVTNPSGTTKGVLSVTVLDKPGKISDLVIKSVTENSVSLEWKKSQEDGGCQISNYVVQIRDAESDVWVDCAATAVRPRIKVNKLTLGKEYQFRVSGENRYGCGEFVTSEKVLVKYPFSKPGPPGIPAVTLVSSDHVVLRWHEPVHDGGSPIISYHVEVKDRNSILWRKANRMDIRETNFKATGLQPGLTYEFRIIAKNTSGSISAPSEPSEKVTCKDSFTPPRLDLNGNLKDTVVVKAGETITLSASIFGKPVPNATWTRNNDSTRDDSGDYVLHLKNTAGSRAISITVKVLDRPGQPIGPLTISEVTSERCRLAWRAPENNGGAPVTHYNIEKRETSRLTWTLVESGIEGVTTKVHRLLKGNEYIFRVIAVNKYGRGVPLESVPVIAKNPFSVPAAPGKPQVSTVMKNSAVLTWTRPTSDGGSDISGYHIERKERNSLRWTRAVRRSVPSLHHKVTGLSEGSEYEFRVSAENAAGIGPPSECSTPALCKEPVYVPVPGAPASCTVSYACKDSIVVNWQEPVKDGGSQITGYHLEVKDRNSILWKKANRVVIRSTHFRVLGLQEGLEYEYRVSAENAAGIGKPSRPSEAAFAHDFRPPRINLDAHLLDEVTVTAGSTLRLHAGISGKPEPAITWSNNGNDIREDLRHVLHTTIDHCSILIKDCSKSDSGVFTINAKNACGEKSANVKVLVLDKPGPPTGPIKFSRVTDSRVTCSWEPPMQDGGSKIINYIISKRETSRLAWSVVSEKEELCTLTVQRLIKNNEYQFRIQAVNKFGVGEPLDSEPVVAKNNFTEPSAPGQPEINNVCSSGCTVMWSRPESDGGADIDGYIVERRERKSARWIKCNKKIVRDLRFKLSNLSENNEYEFRVAAENAAGIGAYSHISLPVVMRDPIDLPGPPNASLRKTMLVRAGNTVNISIAVKGRPTPNVTWTKDNLNVTKNPRVHVDNVDGKTILVIQDCTRDDTGKYALALENASGVARTFVSIRVLDTPGQPGLLNVKQVTKEYAIITWDAPLIDGGSEVINYHVDKRETTHRSWSSVTSDCKRLTWKIDGLNKGSKYVFRIAAENKYGLGEFTESQEVVAKHPFRTPTVPPQPEVVEISADVMTVVWKECHSDGGSQITGYHIEKKERNAILWTKANLATLRSREFKATGLTEGLEYQFRVYAENMAGKSAPSEASKPERAHNVVSPPTCPDWTDITRDSVTLVWKPPKSDGGSKIIGYNLEKRSGADGRWLKCNYTNVQDCEFTATALNSGEKYQFRVTARNASGTVSKPSIPSAEVVCHDDFQPPMIQLDTDILDGVNIRAGVTLRLKANVTGKPAPKIVWTRDGKEFVSNAQTEITKNKNVCMVTIKDTTRLNSGCYVISARNPCATKTMEVKVLVLDKPEVLQSFTEPIVVRKGGVICLKVPFKCRPSPQASWKKISGPEVDLNVRAMIALHTDSAELVIKGVDRRDAGEYEVTLSNKLGKISVSIRVQVIGKPDAPEGPLQFGDIQATSVNVVWKPITNDGGSEVTNYVVEKREVGKTAWMTVDSKIRSTQCTVKGLTEGKEYFFRVFAENAFGLGDALKCIESVTAKNPLFPPQPPQLVEINEVRKDKVFLAWTRSRDDGGSRVTGYFVERKEAGSERWVRSHEDMIRDRIYQIGGLDQGAEYEFRIFAINDQGRSRPKMMETPVSTKKAAGEKPVIVETLQTVMGVRESTATLTCTVSGRPMPDITWWYKGGREITGCSQYKISEAKGNHYTLVVHNVTVDHEGPYTVRATNQAGSISQTVEMTVQLPAKINLPKYMMTEAIVCRVHEVVSIKVPIEGKPQPDITWSKAGKLVSADGHRQFITASSFTSMTITNADRRDSGFYNVIVKNRFGTNQATIELLVGDVPAKPESLKVSNVTRDSVDLTWKEPSDNGGKPVLKYVLEKCTTSSDCWVKVSSSGTCKYTVCNLSGKTGYLFRVRAENEYGQSKPSSPSDAVTTKEDRMMAANYDDMVDATEKFVASEARINKSNVMEKYQIMEQLGRGTFGTVHRAREILTGKTYAVKLCRFTDETEKVPINREVSIMRKLQHPRVLQLHEVFDTKLETALVVQFVSGGDLLERIIATKFELTENACAYIIKQVLEALAYVHSQNVAHLDIKPENILFITRKSKKIKLIDFGVSRELKTGEGLRISFGTPDFCAPEVVQNDTVGCATDMWSVGVLTYLMLTGLSPFQGENDNDTLRNVSDADYNFEHEAWRFISDDALDFIDRLLLKDKRERMTADDALEHPWLRTGVVRSDDGNYKCRVENAFGSSTQTCEVEWTRTRRSIYLNRHKKRGRKTAASEFSRIVKCPPEFTLPLYNRTVYTGDTAIFTITVTVHPTPEISWYHKGQKIIINSEETHYAEIREKGLYTLEIRKSQLEDSGEVIVQAKNAYGEDECKAMLTVQDISSGVEFTSSKLKARSDKGVTLSAADYAPSFQLRMRSHVVPCGMSTKLSAFVRGRPEPQVTWYRNGTELASGGTKYYVSNIGGVTTLEIVRCHEGDSGTYRCSAKNYLGENSDYSTLEVTGSEFESTASKRGVQDFHMTMDMVDVRSTISRSRFDAISQATERDASRSSTAFDDQMSHASGFTPYVGSETPYFVIQPKSQYVLEGDSAYFAAQCDGKPSPKLTWYHDGRIIKDNEKYSLGAIRGKRTLEIRDCQVIDVGNYVCIAESSKGSATTEFTLDV
uniref:non-specific serine/threonine protein kinase n=1 Tax=Ciona savignyi TaxID=51511 RepID=H2YFC9_CIOSA